MPKWKVYISSTFIDLKEHRAKLIAIIQNELQDSFELTEIMERMYDKGEFTLSVDVCTEAVKSCDIFLIILANRTGSISPDGVRTYTEVELETAIAEHKKIFSFHLTEFDDDKIDNKEKHNELLNKLRSEFKGKDMHPFSNLIQFENKLLKSLNQFAWQLPINKGNPYKGLSAFTVDDGDYFFGRHKEVESCLKKITTSEKKFFISITGNSGTGKSSFVQAGVLFALKHRKELGFSEYLQIKVTPGKDPFTNLKYQLHLQGISIKDLTISNAQVTKVILFFDQFEEVVTQCHSPEAQLERIELFAFLDTLVDSVNTSLEILVITSFRSDFHSQLANYPFIQAHQFVFPLSSLDYRVHEAHWEESIKGIITRPALKNGVEIEKEFVLQLIEELKEVEGSLPILQFALQQIWNNQTIEDRVISSKEYNQLSESRGLTGILETHAERVIGAITQNGKEQQKEAVLKSIFVNLTEVNENFSDVKRTVTKDELFNKLSIYPKRTASEVFEALVNEDSRLIKVREEKDNMINVDIVHEVLIRKWGRLRIWINERREALEFRKRLISDIKAFEIGNESSYTGKKLERAKDWKNENLDLTNTGINEFLKKSEGFDFKERKRELIGAMKNNESLSKQIQAVAEDLDGIKELRIANNAALYILQKNFGYFKNIEKLQLNRLTNLRDLSVIKSMEQPNKIDSLTIYESSLGHLKGIEQLHRLKELDIYDNVFLTSLEGLEKLEKLSRLSICRCPLLFDLRGIEKLKGLTNLTIVGNYDIQILVSKIKKLPALKVLNIQDNDILKNLQELRKLVGLESLTLSRNKKLNSLTGIADLQTLYSLELADNANLPNLHDISEIDSLRFLTLSGHHNLYDFRGIEEFPAIHSISLTNNRDLNDLQGIEKFPSLESLYIYNNKRLTSILGIEKLSALNYLYLSRIPNLIHLEGIEKLSSLRSLKISGPLVKLNIEAVHELSKLEKLEIPKDLESDIDRIKINNPKIKITRKQTNNTDI